VSFAIVNKRPLQQTFFLPAEQKIWKTDVTFLFLTSIYRCLFMMIFSINSMFIIYYDSIHYASWMQFQWSIKLCHYNLPKNLQILRLEHRFQRIVLEKALLNFMSFIYNCYSFLIGIDLQRAGSNYKQNTNN
jgi:hypothetical protein